MRKFVSIVAVAATLAGSATTAGAQDFGAMLGGAGLGAALGAAAGGRHAGAGAVVGGIIGVAMATVLQQLSQAEMQNRQSALQKAARGRSAQWSSGKRGAKARYVNKGHVAGANGQKCSKVQETITLPDGKQATSLETVCFS